MKDHLFIFFVIGILGVVIVDFIPGAVSSVFERTSSYKEWFQYHRVYPEKQVYNIGEDVYFISDSTVKRIGFMEWTDILKCENDGEYKTYSIYNSSANVKTKELSSNSWKYQEVLPSQPTECYLETRIKFTTPRGHIKYQVLDGINYKFNFK